MAKTPILHAVYLKRRRVCFTFNLKMYSSARRLKKEGIFTMAWRYSVNYLWTIFLKRPFTQEHIDIREGSGA